MNEHNRPEDDSRRSFLKGAAATGIAATGLTAFSGNAAAAPGVQNVSIGDVSVGQDGLLNVAINNVNALNNLNVEDIAVTVIGGDVRVLETVDIDDSLNDVIDVTVTDVDVEALNGALNNNDVQVSVVVLGSGGNVLAAGDTIA